ncbi:MAG: hypothetical protein Q9162_001888 [Coniocarpon cinnabarinum]
MTAVKKHGIFIQIRRDCNPKDPAMIYDWRRIQPLRVRDSLKYIESRDDEFFSVFVSFLSSEKLEFDQSMHWKLQIEFEGKAVYKENITNKQVSMKWSRNIAKANIGRLRGKSFCFEKAKFPNEIRDQDITNEGTNQDTISVRFFRLAVEGVDAARSSSSDCNQVQESTERLDLHPKKLLSDPQLQHAHRPGARAKPKAITRLIDREPKYKYLQLDDEVNPFYICDFKLRNARQLRELGLIAPTNERYLQRAGQSRHTKKQIEAIRQRQNPFNIINDNEEDDDDECQILEWNSKPPPVSNSGSKRKRQAGTKAQRRKKPRQNVDTDNPRGSSQSAYRNVSQSP